MTKAELARKIAAETGVSNIVANAVLESAVSNIKKSIADGESVFIRGFGTFNRAIRKEKPGRVITRNTTITIPEHPVPVFKPSKIFKKEVK